ncbi:MAG TPA: type II secretion system F family protein [Terriglobia bacterium]|nr:type II secretion system F family protein [Terriglobia bacterium]
MSPVLLFGFLLLLTFGVLVWMLRPSKTEADVQRHLSSIGGIYGASGEAATILKQEALSSVPLVSEFLGKFPGAIKLRLLIFQAGLTWTVARLLVGSLVAAGLAGWVSSWFLSFPMPLVAAGAMGFAPYGFLLWKRGARFQRFGEILPDAIDLMSRALKAGHATTSMIEMVAQETPEPVAGEFRLVFEQQNLGLPIRDAILNLAERVPIDDVRFLATAILVQKETGGNLAEILDKTAAIMRERIRLKGQVRIYTAQGRVSGWVLGMMPFIMFVLLTLIHPDYEKKLWTDPLGIHLIYAGLFMMGLGILIIRKIVDIKV